MNATVGFLVACVMFHSVQAVKKVKFFAFQPICEGDEDSCGWAAGRSMNESAMVMVDRINKAQTLGSDYVLEVETFDTHCSGGWGLERTTDLLLLPVEKRPFGLLGCGCSGCTTNAARLLNIAHIPHISHTATSAQLSVRSDFPSFFRIMPPDGPCIRSWFAVFRSLSWTRFAHFYDQGYGSLMMEAYSAILDETNGEMVDVLSGNNLALMKEPTMKDALPILEKIMQTKVRAIMFNGYAPGIRQFLCQAIQHEVQGLVMIYYGWLGTTWMTDSIESHVCDIDQMKMASEYFLTSNPPTWGDLSSPAPCDPSFTIGEFKEEYEKRIGAKGIEKRAEASYMGDTVCMMALLIGSMLKEGYTYGELKEMNEATFAAYVARAQSINFAGLSGPVAFPADTTQYGAGDRLGAFDVFQVIDGAWELIGSALGKTVQKLPGKDFKFFDGYSGDNPPPMLFPSCPTGKRYNYVTRECDGCPEFYSFNIQTESCFLWCPAGYTATPDASSCVPCGSGAYKGNQGTNNCTACEPGKYQPQKGMSECTRCSAGEYTDTEGQTTCTACPHGFTTLYQAALSSNACVCAAGSYLPSKGGECQNCPEGMVCEAGSDQSNYDANVSQKEMIYPKLLPQYWSHPDDPLSVYRCANVEVCPGGQPGDCPENLEGTMCSQCPKDTRRKGDSCLACTDIETSRLLFPILPLLLGPIFVAVFYWRNRDTLEEWGAWNNGVAALFLLLLNHYQMVGLIRETKLQLTESVKEYWEVFTYLNSLMSILSPDCAGMADFRVAYIVGALLPLIVAAIFFETFVISMLVSKIKPELRMDSDHTLNGFLSLLFAFYVAVCKGSIDVFLCDKHPNDTRTLSRAPYVYCDSDDWQNMFGVGVFALVVFCLLTGAVFSYQLWIAPQVFHLPYFQKRWKFLVMKFRPDVWWWGAAWLFKGLVMNLVLLSTTSFGQLFGLFLVMCMYLMATVTYYPWRHMAANLSDRQICVSIQVVAFLALCNDSFQFESPEAATWCLVVSCSPMFMFACLCLALVTQSSDRVKEWTQARYQLVGLHLQRSFAPMVGTKQEDLVRMLAQITEADVAKLVDAADVIMAEFCGQQARKSRFHQRLIANQKRTIPDCNVNGIAINRRVDHATAECQFLHLDEALPANPALNSLKLITGVGLRDSAESLSKAALSVSQDMGIGADKAAAW